MAGTTEDSSAFQHQVVNRFSVVDYFSFGTMLGISVLIGIYYGFFGSKQNSKSEYLMGGRTMNVIPVAISLIASHTSGNALLSAPVDIYNYGSNYIWLCNSVVLCFLVCSFVYIPVFHKLQLTSSYEYLYIRFDKNVRSYASFLYTLYVVCSSPITIYVPALAFSHATDTNVHVVALIICSICIFYTTFGGAKAVVWSDTLQTVVMAAAMVLVLALGIKSAYGFFNILDISRKGHRLDFEFKVDPTIRDSFWTYTIGATVHWFGNVGVTQVTVQRLLSVPTLRDARRVIIWTTIGIVFVKISAVGTGLIVYAKYANCDPLLAKKITRTDQLLPYYVLDVAGHIPGLSGLFLSGVLGAALSTLSGVLNTVAATIYEDFISPFMSKDITERKISYILKLIVIIAGTAFTALVFIVENLGGIMPLAICVNAMTAGVVLGLFSLGMLFPSSNAKGALCGGIFGLTFSLYLVVGNLWYKNQDFYNDPAKPFSVDGCSFPVNISSTKPLYPTQQSFYLFRVSFWYYSLMGAIVTITIGLITSWFTGKNSELVHPDLLSPVVNLFLNRRVEKIQLEKMEYLSIDKALRLVTDSSKT